MTKAQEVLEVVKGSVRPYISIVFVSAIAFMAVKLSLKYFDAEMAKMVLIFVLAEGSTIIGFHFGERSQKTKQ